MGDRDVDTSTDNIKMYLTQIGSANVGWIKVDQDQWQVLVSTMMSFQWSIIIIIIIIKPWNTGTANVQHTKPTQRANINIAYTCWDQASHSADLIL
jgi:hypothetical protein